MNNLHLRLFYRPLTTDMALTYIATVGSAEEISQQGIDDMVGAVIDQLASDGAFSTSFGDEGVTSYETYSVEVVEETNVVADSTSGAIRNQIGIFIALLSMALKML